MHEGEICLSADDGTADAKEFGHLYRVKIEDGMPNAEVVLEKNFSDFKDCGEIEGVTVDHKTGELLVHANRGKKIVLGMPKGSYPGYEREISDVHVYKMTPRCPAKQLKPSSLSDLGSRSEKIAGRGQILTISQCQ